jgi:spermidine/putrescine transport system substrate-binding protein
MTKKMKQKLAFISFLTLGALIATSCGGSEPEGTSSDSFKGQTLTVANWKDYGSDISWAIEQFESETGAKVVHQYFNSEEELLQILRDGGIGKVDVALPNLAYVQPAIADDLLEIIDTTKLQNYAQLDENLKQHPDLSSGGKIYGVPWMWGSTGLAYNTATPPADAGKWASLWNPENKGKVAFFDDVTTAIMTAALYLGEDPYNPDLSKVKESLVALKSNSKMFWASADDWTKGFATGQITVGNLWSGLAGTEIGRGQPINYLIPDQGAVGWLDSWAIVKNAPNKELAYKWIDFMTSAGYQQKWAEDTERSSPAPANLEATKAISKETAQRIGAVAEWLPKLTLQKSLPAETMREWTKLWEEVKAD